MRAPVQIARARQISGDGPSLAPDTHRPGADEQGRQRSQDACAARHAAILTAAAVARPHIRLDAAARPALALTFFGSSFSASS